MGYVSAKTKVPIPDATRRAVARRLADGAEPERHPAPCAYCGADGSFYWPRRIDGKPGGWVHFSLELDHVYPEALGGTTDPENMVPACRSCNRRKGSKPL